MHAHSNPPDVVAPSTPASPGWRWALNVSIVACGIVSAIVQLQQSGNAAYWWILIGYAVIAAWLMRLEHFAGQRTKPNPVAQLSEDELSRLRLTLRDGESNAAEEAHRISALEEKLRATTLEVDSLRTDLAKAQRDLQAEKVYLTPETDAIDSFKAEVLGQLRGLRIMVRGSGYTTTDILNAISRLEELARHLREPMLSRYMEALGPHGFSAMDEAATVIAALRTELDSLKPEHLKPSYPPGPF